MRRLLAAALLVLVLAAPACAGPWTGVWKRTCAIMGFKANAMPEPKVIRVKRTHPILGGECVAIYIPYINTVYTSRWTAAIVAHEFVHAILSSEAYQEPRALAIERYF